MNNKLQSILHCPKCEGRKDSVDLGSISAEGYIIMKRPYGRYTMLMSQTYSIICDCGYFIRVNNGKILADAASSLSMND